MLIAITGGIGAGKSVISSVMAAMGYEVYDCDLRAKQIMDNDAEIKRRLAEEISESVISDDGAIDRKALAQIVFSDPVMLGRLNDIVHSAVRDDLLRWAKGRQGQTLFVETAILYESGLDKWVDAVWVVMAPEHLRIDRVVSRNACTRQEVAARIEAQKIDVSCPHHSVWHIINDGNHSVLLQIDHIMRSLSH